MVLDQRAGAAHRRGLGVVDEEHHVRIAHAHRAGRVQVRIVDRADLQLDVAGVHLLGQRHLRPVEAGFAHVDADVGSLAAAGIQDAGGGLDAGGVAARRLHQNPADAAGGVAAGVNLRAVGVPDAHAGVGLGRGIDGDQLVAAHARRPIGDGAHFLGRRLERLGAGLDNDEVVAEPVHLQKRAAHGRRYIGQAAPKRTCSKVTLALTVFASFDTAAFAAYSG